LRLFQGGLLNFRERKNLHEELLNSNSSGMGMQESHEKNSVAQVIVFYEGKRIKKPPERSWVTE